MIVFAKNFENKSISIYHETEITKVRSYFGVQIANRLFVVEDQFGEDEYLTKEQFDKHMNTLGFMPQLTKARVELGLH